MFSNLNATGRCGPTSLGSYYAGKDHDGQVALSSGIQQWTVPHTGDYRIEAIGAAGGYDQRIDSPQYRGRGARMIGTFRLNKGEVEFHPFHPKFHLGEVYKKEVTPQF